MRRLYEYDYPRYVQTMLEIWKYLAKLFHEINGSTFRCFWHSVNLKRPVKYLSLSDLISFIATVLKDIHETCSWSRYMLNLSLAHSESLTPVCRHCTVPQSPGSDETCYKVMANCKHFCQQHEHANQDCWFGHTDLICSSAFSKSRQALLAPFCFPLHLATLSMSKLVVAKRYINHICLRSLLSFVNR